MRHFPHEEKGIHNYLKYADEASAATDAVMASKFLPQGIPFRSKIIDYLYTTVDKYAYRTAKEVAAEFVSGIFLGVLWMPNIRARTSNSLLQPVRSRVVLTFLVEYPTELEATRCVQTHIH